jgi:putative transcriptional regulator
LIKKRELSLNKTLKRSDIAEGSGVSRYTIWRMLSNPNHPVSARNIDRLCQYFNCSVGDLFPEED